MPHNTPTKEAFANTSHLSRLCLLVYFLLISARCHAQSLSSITELTFDQLKMLEDFELKQLRDFVRGRGSVSKAGKDEKIDLFNFGMPSLTGESLNRTDIVDLGGPMQIRPSMIEMPADFKLSASAKGMPSKKPKLKIRRKGAAEKSRKDVQLNSSFNGLREDHDVMSEHSNRSEDLTNEDYEKLAKLLQTFVNRRKTQLMEPEAKPAPTPAFTSTSSADLLSLWTVTQKTTLSQPSRSTVPAGLSKIIEQEEEATFVVKEQIHKPELASVWHEQRTSTTAARKSDLKEEKKDLESQLMLVDNEVQRDPKEWELKMRQLSRELSFILHRLKSEKEQSGLAPKADYKMTLPIPSSVQPESDASRGVDSKSVFEVVDNDAEGARTEEKMPKSEEKQQEESSDFPQHLTLNNLKINQKTFSLQQGLPSGKAYVTILREGLARQTDINEYVFVASITLIRDSKKVILVDTGLATDINGRTDLLKKLGKLDIAPPNVDYVITTHGHPDHAGNINDFPDAIHFQGNMLHYHTKFNFSDLFEKDLHQLTPNIQLIKTPGHTPDDITVLVHNTDKYGTIAVSGDVFVAEEDIKFPLMWKPMSWSERTQEASRKRLVCTADYIVPGHGKMFKVTDKMRSNFKC